MIWCFNCGVALLQLHLQKCIFLNYKRLCWWLTAATVLFLTLTAFWHSGNLSSILFSPFCLILAFSHVSRSLFSVWQGSGSSSNLSSAPQCSKHQHSPASQSGRYAQTHTCTHTPPVPLLHSSCYSDDFLTHWGRILSFHDLDCSISYFQGLNPHFTHSSS